ncbi:MAG: arsenate reductase ArsC [Planctomycetes bacterium]|nr:arsenate reductase ArsC [Planctomycetota bacterium]MBI3834307.1 arsenate reductase ArsC [Planctomycetota bacterium]
MNSKRPIKVLFLCTANSCRSQMAEAILRQVGGERFEAFSAGSQPAGFVHALAIDALAAIGVPIGDQRSKSWNELAATEFDAVITLCDSAAEACPNFSGPAIRAHWSTPDPAMHIGSDDARLEFAVLIAQRLRNKIQRLTEIDFAAPEVEVERRLRFLGEI